MSTLNISFSEREEECAYYLLRGCSAKEIGRTLRLSHRTVEIYLTRLKEKLNCKKISSLVVKLVELGYLENIPPSILMRHAPEEEA